MADDMRQNLLFSVQTHTLAALTHTSHRWLMHVNMSRYTQDKSPSYFTASTHVSGAEMQQFYHISVRQITWD